MKTKFNTKMIALETKENRMAALVIADDLGAKTKFPLALSRKTRIGRDPTNDIHINDKTVAPFHASIEYNEEKGKLFITDERSVNGVIINGRRSRGSVELKENDQVIIGLNEFTVEFEPAEREDIPSAKNVIPLQKRPPASFDLDLSEFLNEALAQEPSPPSHEEKKIPTAPHIGEQQPANKGHSWRDRLSSFFTRFKRNK